MAYLEIKIVDKSCINHLKITLLKPFFINLLLIEAKLFSSVHSLPQIF